MTLPDYLKTLDYNQLHRFHCRVWERMTRNDGYQPYGYDWPTVRASYPGWYVILKAVRSALNDHYQASKQCIVRRTQ
jgi:hypothetical protein